MAWSQIVGHVRIKKILQTSFIEGKVASSYLFHGADGVGKDAMALEFAKLLNCDSPTINNNSADACERCRSCRNAAAMQHNSIQYVFALPTGKNESKDDPPLSKLSDEQISSIMEQIAKKSDNIYHQIAVPSATQIRIGLIRDIKRKLTLADSGSGRRCIIISSADMMNPEAANAFLKTLEEPNPNTTIILTTSRQDKLLPTIVSRCTQIYYEQIEPDLLVEFLQNTKGLDSNEAKIVAAFSQGSVSRALEFIGSNIRDRRDFIINLLRSSLKKSGYRSELATQIDTLIQSTDKKSLEQSLQLLLFWLQDAYKIALAAGQSGIVNSDDTESLIKFSSKFSPDRYPYVIAKIEESISNIYRNVNLHLNLLTLFIYTRKILL